MRRVVAVSAVLARIETLLHMEEVERSFGEALQNAWLRLREVQVEMFAVLRPRPAGLQSPVS